VQQQEVCRRVAPEQADVNPSSQNYRFYIPLKPERAEKSMKTPMGPIGPPWSLNIPC
jgi:hypothetical protein